MFNRKTLTVGSIVAVFLCFLLFQTYVRRYRGHRSSTGGYDRGYELDMGIPAASGNPKEHHTSIEQLVNRQKTYENAEKSGSFPGKGGKRPGKSAGVGKLDVVDQFPESSVLQPTLSDIKPPFRWRGNYIEPYNTMMMYRVMNKGEICRDHGLALDIGASQGWYTMELAAMGCRVFAFEPVKDSFLYDAVTANKFNTLVSVYHHAVSVDGGYYTVSGDKIATAYKDTPGAKPLISLGELVDEELVMVKISADGMEVKVLMDLLELIESGIVVHNIVAEVTPKWWGRYSISLSDGIALLEKLSRYFDLYSNYWSNRSLRETSDPHRMRAGTNFDTDALTHVQIVPAEKIKSYFTDLYGGRQRDILFRWKDDENYLPPLAEFKCKNPDEWAYDADPTCKFP